MKKIKTYGVMISFILSIILHFIYNIMPNTFISIIAPVNESIWEHMKLIVSSSLIFSVIEYIIYKTNNIPFNNFLFLPEVSASIESYKLFLYNSKKALDIIIKSSLDFSKKTSLNKLISVP